MITLFSLFVLGLVLLAALDISAALRHRRPRSLVTNLYDEPVGSACSPNEQAVSLEPRIIGLSFVVGLDGVHLEFYLPPNKLGTSSAITHLVSTRQRDDHGILYEMATVSGSQYLVSMDDATAKQMLATYYAWKARRAKG